ncbi:[PSI+] inducibility protein 3, partial [Neolecta irregularis DAH-3]
ASLQAKLDSQLGFSNEVKPSKQPSITATPTSSPAPPAYAGIAQAEAMYAYTATDQGDLALVPGDKITIIEYINSDWWKGSCNGREGIFPANYVLKLDSQKEKFGTPAPYGNPVYPQPAPVPQEEENKLGKYGKRCGCIAYGG